jgi:hypothetical protein
MFRGFGVQGLVLSFIGKEKSGIIIIQWGDSCLHRLFFKEL